MWENVQRIRINRDHAVVIPRACQPGAWFGAGEAFLAPLHRKRALLIDRSKWVYAWTLYNRELGCVNWAVSPEANLALLHRVDVRSRSPSGWLFTVPIEIRRRGWLPESGGYVVLEYSDTEINFWTELAYNEEAVLEADSI